MAARANGGAKQFWRLAVVAALAVAAAWVAWSLLESEPAPEAARATEDAHVPPREVARELGEIAPDRVEVHEAAAPAENVAVETPDAPVAPPVWLVTGNVTDSKGQRLAGVAIHAWRASEFGAAELSNGGVPAPASEARSDAAGVVVLELVQGEYVFTFGDAFFQVPQLGAELIDRAGRTFEFQLPPLASLQLVARTEDGANAPGIKIQGWSGTSGSLRLETSVFGAAEAKHLPAGEYRLLANDPLLGRGDMAVVLLADVEAKVEIVLRKRTW